MAGRRSRYSDAERQHALELIAQHGIAHAYRETGIHKSNLTRWAQRAGIDIGTLHREQTANAMAARQAKREEFRGLLLDKAVDMLHRMDEPHIDFRGKDAHRVEFPRPAPEGCKAYATAAAILIDKLRLELGEATARHEFGGIDPKVAAVDQVDELAARRGKQAA